MNTYALNFFISGFLLQENLFKYESQILLYHVWYRNISGNIKEIKFLRRLFWIEAILSIVKVKEINKDIQDGKILIIHKKLKFKVPPTFKAELF